MSRPQLKDRLGAWHPWGSSRRAQNLATTAIPNNETIVVMGWTFWPGTMVGAVGGGNGALQMGVSPYIVAPTVEKFGIITDGATQTLFIESRDNGVLQRGQLGLSSMLGDHLLVGICDRDNTKLEGWVDNARVVSDALTSNPDFSASSRSYFFFDNVSVRKVEGAIYRTILLSLANGATPTQAQWAEILRYMRDPDAPLHPLLVAAKGTVYSDYYCGEGLDGSATLEDQGDAGDDLTWQGENVEDVRYRAQTSRRRTRRTFYSLISPYTAATPGVDFGFGALPVAARFMFDGMTRESNHSGVVLLNGAGTHFIRIRVVAGVGEVSLATGGAPRLMVLSDDQAENGGDVVVVCIGTAGYVFFNGQLVGQLTLTAPLDLSGSCGITLDGRSKVSSIQAYNETFTVGDITELLRYVVQDPESWLGLTNDPLVDFPIRSDLIAAGGNTVANQGTGGGTLTLSAQRSTSCQEVRHGSDP